MPRQPTRHRRELLAGLAAIALFFAMASVPQVAAGQVEVGRRALDEADFRRAVRAFDRAERSDALERDELAALYEGRATARFALGEEEGARADLRALASLDPQHRFPAEAPPELAETLATLVREAGGGLALELRWSDAPGGSALTIEVRRDVASLVRTVRVHTRVGTSARWRAQDARTVVVAHPPGARVQAFVEALGPGGAVVAREGTLAEPVARGERNSPRGLPGVEAPGPESAPPLVLEDRDHDDTPLLVGVGIGAGVAVVVAVVVGVVVGTQGGGGLTQPSTPIVVGF